MNKEKTMDCERNRLLKIASFRLSNKFLTVSLVIILLSIVMMFIRAFAMEGDTEWLKLLLQKGLLIGMLIMSLSKDKIEDEMTISLSATTLYYYR